MNTIFIKGLTAIQEIDINKALTTLNANEHERKKVTERYGYLIRQKEIDKVKGFYQYTTNIVTRVRERPEVKVETEKKPNMSHYDVAATKVMLDNQYAQLRAASRPPEGYFKKLREGL